MGGRGIHCSSVGDGDGEASRLAKPNYHPGVATVINEPYCVCFPRMLLLVIGGSVLRGILYPAIISGIMPATGARTRIDGLSFQEGSLNNGERTRF